MLDFVLPAERAAAACCLSVLTSMPLIVVSGLPSSGKSSAATALADVCRALGQDVVVVDEDSLHLRRNDSYKGEAAGCAAAAAAAAAAATGACSAGTQEGAHPAIYFRTQTHADAASEKVARGALLSAVERSLTRRRTVICDTQVGPVVGSSV